MIAILSLALGCRSFGGRRPADCTAPATTTAVPDSQAIAALAGSYELVTVITARGYGGGTTRVPLELMVPDSTWRDRERRSLGRFRRRRSVLMGRLGPMQEGAPRGTMVQVVGAIMAAGCLDCNDASPTWYGITAVSESGFAGRWVNHQTGIGVAVDRWGRRLPNPEGYFCARRLAQ